MKRRDLKMLWNSNAPWSNSGYGVHMGDLLPRLVQDGWPTAIQCFYGLEGYPIEWKGIKCYPKMAETWGTDGMVHHAQDFKSDAVFSMQDVWPLDSNFLQRVKNWISYCPIDKDPVPPGVLEKLRYAYKIITFSEFGQRTLEKEGFTSTLIPESTDTEIFKPMDKLEARKKLNIPPDIFLIGSVGENKINPPRKGWQELLEGFKLFHDNHPKSGLFIHTLPRQQGGFPIIEYGTHLGIISNMYFIDDYHVFWLTDSPEINIQMNAFDLFVLPSQTEGFGLPIIEAQSAGTPVVVNDCTSMPELIKPGITGDACKVAYKRWSADCSFVSIADVNSLNEKMEIWYQKLQDPKVEEKIAQDCREWILEKYDINKSVKEKWIPALEDLQEELLGKPQLTETPKNAMMLKAG